MQTRIGRKLFLTAVLAVGVCVPLVAEEVVYAPMALSSVADLGGPDHRYEFHTRLLVQNASGTQAAVSVSFRASGGEPARILCEGLILLTPPEFPDCFYYSGREFELAPYQVDSNSTSFNFFPFWYFWGGIPKDANWMTVGWAEVTSSAPVRVAVELLSAQVGGGPETIHTLRYTPQTPGRGFGLWLPDYNFKVCLGLEMGGCHKRDERRRAALSLLNPSTTQTATLTLTLHNTSGEAVGEETLTLQPLEVRSGHFFDGGVYFGERPKQGGSVEIWSSQPVVPLLLETDGVDWKEGVIFPLASAP